MPQKKRKYSKELTADNQLLIITKASTEEVVYINSAARELFGLKKESLQKGDHFYEKLIHPDDLAEYKAQVKNVGITKENEEQALAVRLCNKKGDWIKFEMRSRPYKGFREKEEDLVLTRGFEILTETEPEESEDTGILPQDKEIVKTQYQQLIDSLDEGFSIVELIFNEDGNPVDYLYLMANPAFGKQVSISNVVGKTVRELVTTPKKDWLNTFGQVSVTGEAVRFQDQNSNLGNSWLDLYTFKVGKPEERKVAILFKNITDRKEAERRLREELGEYHRNLEESNRLLQTVFDTTNLGIVVFKTLYDEDGSIRDFEFIRVNKVLREMYLDKDILGQSYLETTKYGLEMGIYDAFKTAMATGKEMDREFFFEKEGLSNWFRITARPQDDLLIATLEDVTARKAEAEELRENILFKQELVRTTPEVILIVNLNTFQVRYINKDILPEAGMTKENVQGKSLTDILPFVHPRDREKVIDLHKKILKSEDEIFDLEIRLKLQGIAWEWFNVRGKVFQRRDENWVDEYVLLVRNITEQKNTQKALLKAETLSIQGEVARTFAHELRNPLASIGMVAEVLNKKLQGPEKEELKPYFKILQRSTKTLNQLVTNLLNVSNYSPAVLEKEDLAVIVESTIAKAADRIYLTGIKLVKNFKGPYFILADREKLEIAILNIVVNASEAITPGEGLIEIDIAEDKTDYILSIKDNGHGLNEEQISRLFDAFYTNKETGMGVGLSSVKNILEEHDARIKVESEPDKGTCFRLYFHNAEVL